MPQSQPSQSARPGNQLLDLLSEADLARLLQRAERVTVPLRTLVTEAGEPSREVHFPLTSVFSSLIPLRDGSTIEVATVGNEGMTGIDLLTDKPASVYRVISQVEGESLRVPADFFRSLLLEAGPLARIIQRYAMTVTHQCGQSAACNLRHDVEERMCRWLLMTHDRVRRDEFYLTQEFLGIMLGVRRQSVSLSASILQEAGLITYSRGNMKILDRPGLEAVSCECYATLRETYRQVMGITGG
ncbi:MAG: Crp/Fnr family transcriptional regulator [Planctomycetota bacterium]|nr:Crp/Fnr family transcriptional regulator [Planctomycetaceae bacterium]MDQ3329198.1 Crp/Fnr family transcriptional regulator [Planctomycetota bacterium]